MGKAIPTQHPAVVLRSHYRQLRALLAVAMIAVVGLTAALVIVANDDTQVSGTTSARPIDSVEYGGFNPAGTPESAPLPQREHPLQSRLGTARYDGGPEEGSAGVSRSRPSVAEQQAFPGLADQARAGGPSGSARYDGGPEEGSRGSGH